MKNLLILSLALLMSTASAQDGGKYDASLIGKYFRGYLVDEKHDTVRGSFQVMLQNRMQDRPWVNPDNSELANYDYYYKNVVYYELTNTTKWFSTKFTILKAPDDANRSGSDAFLHVLEYGPITMFDYCFFDDKVKPPKSEVKEYMQLPNGEVISASSLLLGFKNKMSGYVKDYPELAAKITNKEKGYGVMGIYNIVREYNKWYMAKNPSFTILKK